jgi:hypothetical protein
MQIASAMARMAMAAAARCLKRSRVRSASIISAASLASKSVLGFQALRRVVCPWP